ncbi:hypothetical protein FACS189454_04360 [Planctomycetales bacterium]|nr:hypothetical protein FACS189454_04360 [Planctomycetales bacterium]
MQPSFISAETNTEKLYQLNSFLKRLAGDVDWEAFRPLLSVLRKAQPKGGRPPFDVVLMFKIIVLKSQYNLSDEMTEFFTRDRKTFQDFPDITLYQTIPDAKTIWLFAEQMKNAGLEEVLFDKFLETLESKGIHPQGGTLVDGTFVEVPRPHNTKSENAQLKKGEIPEDFKSNPHRLAQKECDGNWAKKGSAAFFGYKDHPWVDAFWKLMWGYAVTPAAVHDSVPCLDVIPAKPSPGCEGAYGDSAYSGKEIAEELLKRGYDPRICGKGYRNHPLTEEQKESNRLKSKVRCRIEHVFGEQKTRMKDETCEVLVLRGQSFGSG